MEKRLTLAAAALALAVIGLLPALMIVGTTFYVAGEFSLTAYQTLLASSKQLALLMVHVIRLRSSAVAEIKGCDACFAVSASSMIVFGVVRLRWLTKS